MEGMQIWWWGWRQWVLVGVWSEHFPWNDTFANWERETLTIQVHLQSSSIPSVMVCSLLPIVIGPFLGSTKVSCWDQTSVPMVLSFAFLCHVGCVYSQSQVHHFICWPIPLSDKHFPEFFLHIRPFPVLGIQGWLRCDFCLPEASLSADRDLEAGSHHLVCSWGIMHRSVMGLVWMHTLSNWTQVHILMQPNTVCVFNNAISPYWAFPQ